MRMSRGHWDGSLGYRFNTFFGSMHMNEWSEYYERAIRMTDTTGRNITPRGTDMSALEER